MTAALAGVGADMRIGRVGCLWLFCNMRGKPRRDCHASLRASPLAAGAGTRLQRSAVRLIVLKWQIFCSINGAALPVPSSWPPDLHV
ncbi:hypothetical protein CHELA40_15380 [Chelatococcus asaccharovorans]|nr:hypothetical protein CHELA17_60236 [Chelatococcus asaccharovorans]CAH1682342.1 hypothetical protein CHELA40_15380 [Chelatococcus asaccharovorans]